MMNCKDIKRNLSAYLDGELPPASRDAFFDHLQGCKPCCDIVGEASFDEALIANVMKVRMTAPASLRYNVLSAISREKAKPVFVPAWRRFAWRPATAMAAMLAMVGVGWRTFQTSFQPAIPVSQNSNPVKTAKAFVPNAVKRSAVLPNAVSAPVRTVVPAPNRAPAPPAPHVERATVPSARPKPVMLAEASIGTITDIRTPDNVANGRFLSRVDGENTWRDAASDVRVKTHMQSAEDTIVTLQLKDGTIVKSNAHTEFVVQRSPTKDDSCWEIRLIRGELWVKTATDVKIISPSIEARTTSGEFGMRCIDGEDSTVIVTEGLVAAHNAFGTSLVAASQATVAASGEAPHDAFTVEDPRGQMEWVYAPTPAHNPQNDGGTQA